MRVSLSNRMKTGWKRVTVGKLHLNLLEIVKGLAKKIYERLSEGRGNKRRLRDDDGRESKKAGDEGPIFGWQRGKSKPKRGLKKQKLEIKSERQLEEDKHGREER